MNYQAFKKFVTENGYTISILRCDNAPPTDALLDLMDRVGLNRYESFVLRLQQESK
jgi:hypothetical protein